jgi:flagellar hook-associated protein 2
VSTYNDLISFYNTETKKNASDETLRGTLHNDPAVRSFMIQIKDYLARGVTLADGTSISFASIGVNFMRDGTLSLDASDSITGISLASAIADGLQTKLASGVSIGYQSETANLSNFIKSALRETAGLEGVLAKRINEVENQQEKLQDRKEEIQSRLRLVEARYYRQYAALDALLFKLNTINNALTSAIEGLVNSQKGD